MKVYFDDNPTSEPRLVYFDDLAPLPKPAPARPARKALRNWQKFVLCYVPIVAGATMLVPPIMRATWPSGVHAIPAVTALALLVWLFSGLIILATVPRERL
jgi:hypothetical protein